MRRTGAWLLFAGLVALASVAPGAPAVSSARADEAAGDFALRGCRVVPVVGDPIDDAVVVVKDGKIESVANNTAEAAPKGVLVIDASGKVLLPGFVHPSSRLGLSGTGGGGSTTVDPNRKASNELDPWRPENAWTAANGFTTLGLLPGNGIVGGTGVAVRTAAGDLETMVRRDDAFLRVNVEPGARFRTGLGKALSGARKELDALEKFETDHAKWEEAKKKAEADKKPVPKEPKKPKEDEKTEAYRKVLRGETALYCMVANSAEVVALGKTLTDERVRGDALRLYVYASGDAFREASILADLGATCVVRAGLSTWPNTLEVVCPAVELRRAGLDVILLPSGESRGALRAFPFELARTIEAGFPRAEAWRAAMRRPAEMLGLEDEIGSIEKGRRADLLLFSGDPLLATTRLERVWIDGEPVEETP